MANIERIRRALELVTLGRTDTAGPGRTLGADLLAEGPDQLVDTVMGLIDLAGILLFLRREETGRTVPEQLADLGQRLATGENRGL